LLFLLVGTQTPDKDVLARRLQKAASAAQSLGNVIDNVGSRERGLVRFININFGYRLHKKLPSVAVLKARGDIRGLLRMAEYSDHCWNIAVAATDALVDLGATQAILPTIELLHRVRAVDSLLCNPPRVPDPEDAGSRVIQMLCFRGRVKIAAALVRLRPLANEPKVTDQIDEELKTERAHFAAHYMARDFPWDGDVAGAIKRVLP